MDFVPEPSTACYERYVSGSDTDGEGDPSRGQQRRPNSGPVYPAVAPSFHSSGVGTGSLLGKKGRESTAGDAFVLERDSSGGASSILSRLAASWKNTTSSVGVRGGGPSIEELHQYQLHAEGGEVGGAVNALRKDVREGRPSPRAKEPAASASASALDGLGHGDRRPTTDGNRSGFREAFAGLSMGSSSGLKGLKSSLLTDKDDGNPTVDSNDGEGVGGGRGLWGEAERGDLEVLVAALAPGGSGDIHACTEDGWTALHAAALAGQSAAVSILVRSGASTAARAKQGWTPLHSACMRGRWQAARTLLSAGADANVRAADQRTPLHFACEAGSSECTKELLWAGAAANVSDQDARTPLHFACIDGSTECVRRLLAAGASPLPPDAWGRDPAAVARQLNRAGPLRLLEAAAAATTTNSTSRGGRKRGTFASPSATSSKGVCNSAGVSRSKGVGDIEGVIDSKGSSSPPLAPPKVGIVLRKEEGEEDAHEGDISGGEDCDQGYDVRDRKMGWNFGGRRWVVMNESGRMLERASGKVALFKSMAAAVDWANGLEITSGSFQVAEVAPAARKAFEEEIPFEITGEGTLSEEEEEERQDPQWTRFRRQKLQAVAARKEKKAVGAGGSRGSGRKRRGAWGVAAQRRDEEEARGLVLAARDKLREIIEERDMHREKALSLEQALDVARKDRKTAFTTAVAVAVAADIPASSVVKANAMAEQALVRREEDDVELSTAVQTSAEASVQIRAEEGPPSAAPKTGAALESRAVSRLNIEDVAGAKGLIAAACAPSLLLGVEDPSGHTRSGGLSPSSEISESETDAEVDDDVINGDVMNDYVSDDVQKGVDVAVALKGVDERKAGNGNGNPRGGLFHKGDSRPPRQCFVEDGTILETPPSDGGIMETGINDVISSVEVAVRSSQGRPTPEAKAPSNGGGSGGRDLLEFSGGNGDDEDAAAVAQEKLAAWLSGLEIRRPDAMRYASNLFADGFDSGEALRGIREEELIQYGMKKGHARLVVRTLAKGVSL